MVGGMSRLLEARIAFRLPILVAESGRRGVAGRGPACSGVAVAAGYLGREAFRSGVPSALSEMKNGKTLGEKK
jgi:hypothetical protein